MFIVLFYLVCFLSVILSFSVYCNSWIYSGVFLLCFETWLCTFLFMFLSMFYFYRVILFYLILLYFLHLSSCFFSSIRFLSYLQNSRTFSHLFLSLCCFSLFFDTKIHHFLLHIYSFLFALSFHFCTFCIIRFSSPSTLLIIFIILLPCSLRFVTTIIFLAYIVNYKLWMSS